MSATHEKIFHHLHEGILSGRYPFGSRLPTETELANTFNASRPTAARALNRLVSEGLINRKVGSGSYVLKQDSANKSRSFGILVPGLGDTEIFEPICGEIVSCAHAYGASIFWGSGSRGSRSHEQVVDSMMPACSRLIDQGVEGVFFAPLELEGIMHKVNDAIVKLLEDANIPIILLDRDYLEYPLRSRYDIVGINNVRAGYMLASHMIKAGAKRVHFIAHPHSAPTVIQRIAGLRHAQVDHGLDVSSGDIHHGDPGNSDWFKNVVLDDAHTRPDALVCANDQTANEVIHALDKIGVGVPDEMMVGGFDDVNYARFLKPSLTTIHQPTEAIGRLAYEAMVTRIGNPDLPSREIRADSQLVVRESTFRS